MALFKAGEAVPGHSFIPRELIVEEAWGEIWRARNATGGTILVVGYTTAEGDAIFEESLPALRKWKEVAESHSPSMLRILEINESAIPYLIVEDPEGETWRETIMQPSQPEMPLEEQATMASAILDAIIQGEAIGIAPLGITPDTIMRSSRTPGMWRLIPVAPKSMQAVRPLAQGRYFPREVTVAEKPGEIHADCYSLAWIWVEGMRRDFNATWPESTEAIPYPKLSLILESTLQPRSGSSNDPALLKKSIAAWVSSELGSDLLAHEKMLKEKSQSAFRRLLNKKKGVLGRFFLTFFIVGSVTVGLATVAMTKAGKNNGSTITLVDSDTVKEFFSALAVGGTGRLGAICSEEAQQQAKDAAAMIDEMKAKGIITGFHHADSRVKGTGASRESEGILYDETGKAFAKVQLSIYQKPDYHWSVVDVYFTQTRFK
ncbi:hypothetical protein IT570_09900 [Candidatus Sumerlaeota bacterium]|nr:hypothetical protein [Candidatus Sumerlaeota bacterium]